MSDLKNAILDARYVDMIGLGDFVVRDCGLPDVDSEGNLMPQAIEIAASVFRWAADQRAAEERAARAGEAKPAAASADADQPEAPYALGGPVSATPVSAGPLHNGRATRQHDASGAMMQNDTPQWQATPPGAPKEQS